MDWSASLILLLWLAMAQPDCTSTAGVGGVLKNVRSGLSYLAAMTHRFLGKDVNVEESPVTIPTKESSLTSHLLSSDIDAGKTPVNVEAVQEKWPAELTVPATEAALPTRLLRRGVDPKDTSVTVEEDQRMPISEHPILATQTSVTSHLLVIGDNAKQTSVTVDAVQARSTTELPLPVTETAQSHQDSPVSTVEQQVWSLKFLISTTEAPQVGDQKTTTLSSASFENSKLAAPITETVDSPCGQETPTTLEENEDTLPGLPSYRRYQPYYDDFPRGEGGDPPDYEEFPIREGLGPPHYDETRGGGWEEEKEEYLPTEHYLEDYDYYPEFFTDVGEAGTLLRNVRSYQHEDEEEEEKEDDDFRKELDLTLGEEGPAQKRSSRSLALLLIPIIRYLAHRTAITVWATLREMVSGAARFDGFRTKLRPGVNVTANGTATLSVVGR